MPRRSSGRLRRLKVATALSRRCSTTIAAYPRVAIRCGRRCITSMVGPQMGRHRRRGFSGGRFPICSRVCCHRSTSCLCQGNVARLLRQVIEGAGCPALNGCSDSNLSPSPLLEHYPCLSLPRSLESTTLLVNSETLGTAPSCTMFEVQQDQGHASGAPSSRRV